MGDTGDELLPDGDLKNQQSVRRLVMPESYGVRLAEIACNRLMNDKEGLADRGDGMPISRCGLHYAWAQDADENAIPFANPGSAWRTFSQYEWGIDYDNLETLIGRTRQNAAGSIISSQQYINSWTQL